MSAPSWRVHDILTVGLLIGIVGSVLFRAHRDPTFGIEVRDSESVTIRDFAAHLTFAKAFWSDGVDYSVESHLAVTREWAGRPVERSLPFGYAPTMLWLLAPLTPLPLVWGFTAWTLLSALAVWWMTRRPRAWWLASTLLLLSPLGVLCFSLGQTAYLGAAGLLLLMVSASRPPPRTHILAADAAPALTLWALAAKPPLAIVGAVVMLAGRRPRPVALAVVLTVVTTLLITPRLGWTWPSEYFDLLRHYDQSTADPAFGWSFRPDTMANLRALLWHTGLVSDNVASAASSALWLLVTSGAWWLGRCRQISMRVTWVLIVVAYLTLFPHVSSTENLQLSLLLAAVGSSLFAGNGLGRAIDQRRRAAQALPFVAYVAVFSLPTGPVLSLSTYTYVVLTAVTCTGFLAFRALSTNGPERGSRSSPHRARGSSR